MYNLTQLRTTEFPSSSEMIYFNHAGISPLPARTQTRVKWAIDELSRNPGKFWMIDGMAGMERFRLELASFINAVSEWEIVPAASTSAALNAVAQAIVWQPGDNIVFCELEFPSNAYPWMSLERDGVEIRRVTAVDGGLTLTALEPLVNVRTRLIAASAIQFFTGHRTDLTAVGQFCHERGILFAVDAIQAIGHMPINVQAMHIDVLASGGQKSLLALPGQGFLYVRQEAAEAMQPRIIGGNSTRDFMHWLHYDLTPATVAQRFFEGTPNLSGMIAVVESLSLLRELGVVAIDQHTRELADCMTAVLTNLGYKVISPQPAHGPIVTFKSHLSAPETDKLITSLAERQVFVVKHLDAQGNPYVRASFHCYNTFEEVERFGEILQQLRQ